MAQPTQERLAAQLEKPEQTSGNVGHAGSGVGPENTPHYQDHEDEHVHHVAMPTYYVVFAFLIFMLFVTVGAWYIDQHVRSLGALSTPIAMAIAVAKAVAIVLIFMHVKFSSKLVQIFACTGVAFVFIMFVLTFNDYIARDAMDLPKPGQYNTRTSPTLGKGAPFNEEQIRVDSVGAAPNAQSAPSDNVDSSARNPQTSVNTSRPSSTGGRVLGANIQISGASATSTTTGGSPSTTTSTTTSTNGQAGTTSAAQVAGGNTDLATNGSASNPGPSIGGAANNSFGSSVQSAGIEPSRNTQEPAPATAR